MSKDGDTQLFEDVCSSDFLDFSFGGKSYQSQLNEAIAKTKVSGSASVVAVVVVTVTVTVTVTVGLMLIPIIYIVSVLLVVVPLVFLSIFSWFGF